MVATANWPTRSVTRPERDQSLEEESVVKVVPLALNLGVAMSSVYCWFLDYY